MFKIRKMFTIGFFALIITLVGGQSPNAQGIQGWSIAPDVEKSGGDFAVPDFTLCLDPLDNTWFIAETDEIGRWFTGPDVRDTWVQGGTTETAVAVAIAGRRTPRGNPGSFRGDLMIWVYDPSCLGDPFCEALFTSGAKFRAVRADDNCLLAPLTATGARGSLFQRSIGK